MATSKATRLTEAAERVRLAGLAERRSRRALKTARANADDAFAAVRLASEARLDAEVELVRIAAT